MVGKQQVSCANTSKVLDRQLTDFQIYYRESSAAMRRATLAAKVFYAYAIRKPREFSESTAGSGDRLSVNVLYERS
jgi:outer membrane phospholipase A